MHLFFQNSYFFKMKKQDNFQVIFGTKTIKIKGANQKIFKNKVIQKQNF